MHAATRTVAKVFNIMKPRLKSLQCRMGKSVTNDRTPRLGSHMISLRADYVINACETLRPANIESMSRLR